MSVAYRLTAATVAAATALLLGGCSGSGDEADKKTVASKSDETVSTGSGAPDTQETKAPVAADLPVLGSHKTAHGDIPLQVDLNEVKADGQVMTVTWSARNLSSGDERWQVASFFADGIFQDGPDGKSADTETGGTADGVFVIDTKNAKRYLPARDGLGDCVCSVGNSSTFISSGQQASFSAVFRAPPADVTTVAVSIPHAGVFSKVTVQR
jgi:hypothetical protein